MKKEEESISNTVHISRMYSRIILLMGVVFSLWLMMYALITNIKTISSLEIIFLLIIGVLYFLPYLIVALTMRKAIFINFFFYSSLIIFIAEIAFVFHTLYFSGSSTDSISIVFIAPLALLLILILWGILKIAEHSSDTNSHKNKNTIYE